MKIGVFSKIGASGGSEHRCAEMCNAIVQHTSHSAVLLCEKDLNHKIRRRLAPGIKVVERVFQPRADNVEQLYGVDSLVIVNTDSYSYAKLDYWEGRTEHHKSFVDVSRIPQMLFLFNYVITPSKNLASIAAKCPDVRVVCANRDFFSEISEKEKFIPIRHLPRMILNSPIDPKRMRFPKTESTKIRIGKHSKAFGCKFNEDHAQLIERVNEKYGDRIEWDFLGVPGERALELKRFTNVKVRPEYSIDVGEYLRGIDIFLFFVSWDRNEPWSRAVAEGMASGCPVLATDRAGNRDQIVHENNGYLCKTMEEFDFWLSYLINNPQRIRQLGRNAQIASKQFESATVVRQFPLTPAPRPPPTPPHAITLAFPSGIRENAFMNQPMNLSIDQIRSLANGDPIPIREADMECVLVRADIYNQLKEIVGEEWTPDEMRNLALRTFHDADTAGPIP